MTHSTLRTFAIQTTLLVGVAGFLAGCGSPLAPKTPQQAMVEAEAAFGAALVAFNVYAAQPFCDKPAAPKPPLCADRAIVVRGDKLANEVNNGLNLADSAIKATTLADTQWNALTAPLKSLTAFQAFVAGVK